MSPPDASVVPPARRWWTLLPFLAAVVAVAGIGGLAASGSRGTYRALDLPPYAPPSWLFGPTWSVLYLLIGVAGWLLWRAGGWDRVMSLWVVQLLLNLAWTPLFFAADLYTVALVEIVALAAAVALLVVWSWRRSRTAAWLLVPYLAWVCFATALNVGIVVLN
ncbi:TspO/MBR family protein [Nocardioides xinjiangensis]|uniref:TspO/MBR family protein n=1 Tax=Nocardioides xinjiangensis TaxID=2817376 RepID=UPI0027DDAF96|nr:TspO/MBR family protein [Nocardioides sp. SYSU D00514]